MAFGTRKPCHGCGETGYRSVDEVCSKCKGLIRAGRAINDEETVKLDKGSVFRLTREWPTIYVPSDDPDSTKKLGQAFAALARTCLRAMKTKKYPYDDAILELPKKGDMVHYFSTYDEGATLWVGTKRVADAIESLDLCVRKAVSMAHDHGKMDGQNLLMQLARGEVSIADLTEAQIEAGRRKR